MRATAAIGCSSSSSRASSGCSRSGPAPPSSSSTSPPGCSPAGSTGCSASPSIPNSRATADSSSTTRGSPTAPPSSPSTASRRSTRTSPTAARPCSSSIPQPFANHNGGMVEFGPDGFLYIGMGDGGSGNDPGNHAQNIDDLLGKILRIDVDRPAAACPYSSPADNPSSARPPAATRSSPRAAQSVALLLRPRDRRALRRRRRPGRREEIDIVDRNGGNYGWRVCEGSTCTGNDRQPVQRRRLRVPHRRVRPHAAAAARSSAATSIAGRARPCPPARYVYGDFCTGEIFLLESGTPARPPRHRPEPLVVRGGRGGEIYVVSTGGSVARLVNVCAPGATGDPLCGSLRLSAGVSQPSFAPGETLSATIGFDNPGLAEHRRRVHRRAPARPDRGHVHERGPRHLGPRGQHRDLRAARDGRGADIAVRDHQAATSSSIDGQEASSEASTRSSCSPSAPAPLRTARSHPTRSSPSPPRRSPFRNSDGPLHFPFSRTSSSGAAHGYGSISMSPGSATRGPIPLTQMNS